MTRPLLVVAALFLVTLQTMPAGAQEESRRGDAREAREARESRAPQPAPPPPPARPEQARERDAQRREVLSPEERRQLRRDIYDHGQEVYRDRRAPR